ncbi:uncharacterized protein C2845_PM02G08880 [Panicum miliaceum]|uniref:Hyaluronan/mRNA-binding protein domain-containing protein n=1 Tax=Panicum miliaceum TaxID=4540 RepID=A0A3L6S625_PANMI|nr:uncharacterized protein C2845_PM02G08880 [Panicum miliaceum]
MKKVYVRKVNASSDAGTKVEEKLEDNVVSARAIEQKDANADNANAVLASESDLSAGLNGSEKRKKKNANKTNGNELEKAKKQDYEVDGSKKQADKQLLEEEKKALVEYERMREEKKFSEITKTEVRKVTAKEFKGLQMLEKKKLDDEEAAMKAEKTQPKVKEASKKEETVKAEGKESVAKDAKPKKVSVPRQDLGFRPPRRVSYDREAVVQNGNGTPTGGYNGRGNDASRVGYSGPGRHDGYNRGNGGYNDGRGNGGFQQERAGNGGYYLQHGGQQQRRAANDRYHQEHRNSTLVLNVEDMSKFPALPVAASAEACAPASA